MGALVKFKQTENFFFEDMYALCSKPPMPTVSHIL